MKSVLKFHFTSITLYLTYNQVPVPAGLGWKWQQCCRDPKITTFPHATAAKHHVSHLYDLYDIKDRSFIFPMVFLFLLCDVWLIFYYFYKMVGFRYSGPRGQVFRDRDFRVTVFELQPGSRKALIIHNVARNGF